MFLTLQTKYPVCNHCNNYTEPGWGEGDACAAEAGGAGVLLLVAVVHCAAVEGLGGPVVMGDGDADAVATLAEE